MYSYISLSWTREGQEVKQRRALEPSSVLVPRGRLLFICVLGDTLLQPRECRYGDDFSFRSTVLDTQLQLGSDASTRTMTNLHMLLAKRISQYIMCLHNQRKETAHCQTIQLSITAYLYVITDHINA